MRASTIVLGLPSLAFAALNPVYNQHVDARHIQIAKPAHLPDSPVPTITGAPTRWVDTAEDLTPRNGIVDAPAAAEPSNGISQYPSITTQWVETVTNGVTTWVEMIYTQKFASVPDQGALPGSGAVGLGTLANVQATGAAEGDVKAGSGLSVGAGTSLRAGWTIGGVVAGMVGVGVALVLG